MTESTKNILKYSDEINKLIKLRNQAHQNIFSNISSAIPQRKDGKWRWGTTASDCSWASVKKDGVTFYIYPCGLDVIVSVYENDKSRNDLAQDKIKEALEKILT